MIHLFNQPYKKIDPKKFLASGGRALILREAKRKGIKAEILERIEKDESQIIYIRLKKEDQSRWISPQRGFFNSKLSCELALYKDLTHKILKEAGLPTSSFKKISALKELKKLKISPPWVVKPLAQTGGKDILVNLEDKIELKNTCRKLFKRYSSLLVEKHIQGNDYRLLILENKLLGALKRIPARIKGDGVQTIRELIRVSNKKERRELPKTFKPFLKPLEIDLEMRRYLKRQNLTLKTIPQKGEIIRLRRNANFSTGGEVKDITEEVHPENIKIARKAIRVLGLKFGGVDIITQDISQPITENKGKIIEVNGIPSLRIHHYPNHGKGRNVAGKIIDYLFKN